MLQLLNISMLIALTGLLAPLLIHLWSRREGKVVKVGSIRRLQQVREKKARRISFSDFWQFILRVLVLVIFVLLLAEPVWRTENPKVASPNWILVEAGESLPQNWNRDNWQVRKLSAGFPLLKDTTKKSQEDLNYWSLLRELPMHAPPPDSVLVLAAPSYEHFHGPRPQLPVPVQWIKPEEDRPACFLAGTWKKGDNILVITGRTEAAKTTFERMEIDPFSREKIELTGCEEISIQPIENGNTWEVKMGDQALLAIKAWKIDVAILEDKEYKTYSVQLEAALDAVSEHLDIPININQTPVDSTEWIFWLKKGPLPDSLETGMDKVICLKTVDHYFQQPIRDDTIPVIWQAPAVLEKPLEDLPRELTNLIIEDIQLSRDLRAVPMAVAIPLLEKDSPKEAKPNTRFIDLRFFCWILLLTLFVIERLYANRSLNSGKKPRGLKT